MTPSRLTSERGRGWQLVSLYIAGCLAVASIISASASSASGRGEPDRWWSPGEGRTFPAKLDYTNEHGVLRTLLVDGPMETEGHPFFEPLGPNGRACVTCHQPADGMALSAKSAAERWDKTGGKDPLFAAYDGSNCPSLPQSEKASHSLLIERGLIRIERKWPVEQWNERQVTPDFTIDVTYDPNGCNTGPEYGPEAGKISVYRRPRPIGNMKYLLAVGFAYDPKQGLPLPTDPDTGQPMSGNLMADGRVGNLRLQMEEAGATHLGMLKRISENDRKRIRDFEMRLFAAQQIGKGGAVDDAGATGGPAALRDSEPGALGSIGFPVWGEFAAWETMTEAQKARLSPQQLAFRQSVARGARIFREKTFLITDSAGITTPMGFGNPVRNACNFCHNMTRMGNDVAPGQVDLGTTTLPFADPFDDLPLFRITCLKEPHPYYGRTFYTYDPGFALTTGRCEDVGKITLQSMRGLSARAPYFSNGLAKDLREVVDYYERRYNIGYTEQEKQDLVNLMSVL